MKNLAEVKSLFGFICTGVVVGSEDTTPVTVDTSEGWSFYSSTSENDPQNPLANYIDPDTSCEIRIHNIEGVMYLASKDPLRNCTQITE